MYYLHPSDEELKSAAGISKKVKPTGTGNKGNNKPSGRVRGTTQSISPEIEDPSTFNIPRNIDIELNTTKITPIEVMGLRFYSDYQWLVDFAVCSAIVYIISEVSLQS